MKNEQKECIVVFSENVENWGAERSVCSMCDILQKQGQKVVMIIPRKGKIINLLQEINVEYIVSPFSKWVYTNNRALRPDVFIRYCIKQFLDYRRISHSIKEKNFSPKLVYSAVILIGIGAYCAKKWKVPHIHHFRENVDAFGYKFIFGYSRTLRFIKNNASKIICTCSAIRNRYINDVNENQIVVINNGVPSIDDLPPKKNDSHLRIVQVARFMNDKRVMDSLLAIKILKDSSKLDNIVFDIYGEGPEKQQYLDFILQNNLEQNVFLKGFCSNIDFSPYQIGLMTSTFEAFARTTLDYMNNGLAVIASNSGGNIEQVENGISGLLYKVGDPSDLARKIHELTSNRALSLQMGRNGREIFLNKFTQKRYQDHIYKEITSLIH